VAPHAAILPPLRPVLPLSIPPQLGHRLCCTPAPQSFEQPTGPTSAVES
jgi:hypothetical protein